MMTNRPSHHQFLGQVKSEIEVAMVPHHLSVVLLGSTQFSPELLATLPKKEIVAQLRAHGLAAPVRCTVADLRQRLLAYLARHS